MMLLGRARPAFGLAGHLLAARFIQDEQARQLDELTKVVMRRSEFAVDLAAASLDELAGRGLATCDADTLQARRRFNKLFLNRRETACLQDRAKFQDLQANSCDHQPRQVRKAAI